VQATEAPLPATDSPPPATEPPATEEATSAPTEAPAAETTGNHSALALLDDEMQKDPSIYPPQELLAKLESDMPIDTEGQKRREELWKELRGD
jgi:hypothetical protein